MKLKTFYDQGVLALGDSITVGQGATTGNAYISKLVAYTGGSLNNQAVSGSGTCTAAARGVGVTKKRKFPITFMSGLNDVRRDGLDSLEKIKANTRAVIAASLLGESVAASSLTKTGTWSALASSAGGRAVSLGGSAQYTNDSNATLTWNFRGTSLVVGSVSNILSSSTYQDIEIVLDGMSYNLSVAGVTDENFAYPCRVFIGLADGPHTVVIKPKSGASWSVVDYVGVLADPGATGPVFVAQIPYVTNWVYNGFTLTQAIVDQVNNEIANIVAEFSSYPVALIQTNNFYDTATGCSTDGVHPNNIGHNQIFEAFKASISMWN